MKMNKKLIEWFYTILSIIAIIYFIVVFDMYFKHNDFMDTYIGRKFVYYGDTITISYYSRIDGLFWTVKNVNIHENLLYQLEEVKR